MAFMNEPVQASCGVIFDLDGTLADTLDDLVECIDRALAEFGHDTLTSEQLRLMIGDGLRPLMRRASGIESDEALDEIIRYYRGIYREGMLRRTELFSGIPEMLDRLCAARIPMAVLSNKTHEFTAPMCEALLARWPFVSFQGMTEEPLKKPDPTVALRLAEQLGFPPDRVYFVGDSAVDVETGRNAGMKSIAVTWGLREEAELTGADPDHVAHQPGQVAEIILDAHVRS